MQSCGWKLTGVSGERLSARIIEPRIPKAQVDTNITKGIRHCLGLATEVTEVHREE